MHIGNEQGAHVARRLECPDRARDLAKTGIAREDFISAHARESHLHVPARLAKVGDLWKPLLPTKGRFSLEKFF